MKQKLELIDQLKAEFTEEKNEIQARYNQLKVKAEEEEDRFTNTRIENERERALADQQIHFQNQRVIDLTQQLEKSQQRSESRLKADKEELLRDAKEKTDRLLAEKQNIEAKFDNKRKQLKDLEARFNKETQDAARENQRINMKFQHLEAQRETQAGQYENEINKLSTEIMELHNQNEGDSTLRHAELERLRKENIDYERTNQDLLNTYDKDKALWEGKFDFLEK